MYNLVAQFPKQQICRDRQYTGLLRWAASFAAQPVPDPPGTAWTEQRVLAEKVAVNIDYYVAQTMASVASVPNIQTNIRQHLNSFNDETTEASMDLQVDSAISAVIPGFAAAVITKAEVNEWLTEHGYPAP